MAKDRNRLADREKTLDNKLEELDRRAEKLRAHEDEVDNLKNEIRDIRTRQQEKLEKIAGLKKKDAADKLMQMTERDIKQRLGRFGVENYNMMQWMTLKNGRK